MDSFTLFSQYQNYIYKFCKMISSKIAQASGEEYCYFTSKSEIRWKKDREDLHQLARLWLWEACLEYPIEHKRRLEYNEKNPDKIKTMANFGTYAYVRMQRSCINFVRKAQCRKKVGEIMSLDEDLDFHDLHGEIEIDISSVKPDNVFNVIASKMELEEFEEKLSETEKYILHKFYGEGFTCDEINKRSSFNSRVKYGTLRRKITKHAKKREKTN